MVHYRNAHPELGDLGALIRFLGLPFFDEPATFRKYVAKIRKRKGSQKVEFENLRRILSSICLRRNKSIVPNKGSDDKEYRLEFSPLEQDRYRILEQICKRAIEVDRKHNRDEKSDERVMEALLRLRMFCNNGVEKGGVLGFKRLGTHMRPDEILSFLQQRGEANCSDCSVDVVSLGLFDENDGGFLTSCWRVLCGECKTHYTNELRSNGSKCRLCSAQHGTEGLHDDGSTIEPSDEQRYPTKVVALVEDLQKFNLTSKAVVFSFWKTSLDIVGKALEDRNISYLRVDGGVPSRKRNIILQNFQLKQACRILIMTFSTGGTGLNGLTVANRVHLLEPQWNPAVEQQAIGRVMRLDQDHKVTIVRYVMDKSIEPHVQSRQFRKLQLARGGFMSAEERRGMRDAQIQRLSEILNMSEKEQETQDQSQEMIQDRIL